MEESNPELETFRQQWKAEVSARGRPGNSTATGTSTSSQPLRRPSATEHLLRKSKGPIVTGDDERKSSQPVLELGEPNEVESGQAGSSSTRTGRREPRSALEHYELAVERESQGNLGDSLDLYRKAFRLDDRIDQKYRNKHFPPTSSSSKHSGLTPTNAPATTPNLAHHSLDGPPQTINELIASFSGLSIQPAPPIILGDVIPPCPIVKLPEEILVNILLDLALIDVASFARLAQVCKRMAYLVATEEQIWKSICLGPEFGFGGMHYKFQREVHGQTLREFEYEAADATCPPIAQDAITEILLRTTYKSSWQQMFRLRPRIRFNGCYISTINYVRPGQASASQVSWNSPVHIVTYFRYLRFFRDGSVISLQTTAEPIDVVQHLTKELLATHRNKASSHLPSSMMQHALRGRWRLSTSSDNPDVELKDAEGDVIVETEGVGPKYVYRLFLSLKSAGKAARNNKLVWKGFWNYNLTTDEDDEFPLRKDDRAFFFSRVKSYGMGT